jgi:quinol monooxygenase YgiN
MIYVIATTPMKPENKDDFIKGHKACTAETLKEKGCISYDGHVSVNNPNLYVVVERGKPATTSMRMAARPI